MLRYIIAREHHAGADRRDLSRIFLRRTEREYAGDRRHDDHVPPLEQCGRRAVAQAVDLLVYRGILFNIYILSGDVCLGLIVVVIRHEEFDGVLGEERAEFGAELCGKGLVVGEHERRRFSRAITFAMVKVLPEPVMPRSVCHGIPASSPAQSRSIACG